MMEESKKIDNTITIFSEILEKYKDREDIKEIYSDLEKLKEKRKRRNKI